MPGSGGGMRWTLMATGGDLINSRWMMRSAASPTPWWRMAGSARDAKRLQHPRCRVTDAQREHAEARHRTDLAHRWNWWRWGPSLLEAALEHTGLLAGGAAETAGTSRTPYGWAPRTSMPSRALNNSAYYAFAVIDLGRGAAGLGHHAGSSGGGASPWRRRRLRQLRPLQRLRLRREGGRGRSVQ